MVAALEKMKLTVALPPEIDDIFSDLDTRKIQFHISGTLRIVKTSDCGRWLHVNGEWHRLLDIPTFLWLRSQVRTAIQSGRLSDNASEALTQLEAIRTAGLQSGQLTAAEIAEHCRPQSSYIWADGIPRWAEWADEAWR